MGENTPNIDLEKPDRGNANWDVSLNSNFDKIDTAAGIYDTLGKIASGTLTADVSGNFAFTWQNPEAAKIIVHRTIINIMTAGGTAGSKLDVGVAASNTDTSDNLIDGLDLNNADVSDNVMDGGTNGKSVQRMDEKDGTNDWITGKILEKDASSLVGKYYIHYRKV